MKTLLEEVRSIMEAVISKDNVDKGIESFIERSRKIQSIEKLPGDASTRRYYRVRTHATAEPVTSLIIMVMEPFEDLGENNPFISIQRHLKRAGVDVPEILDFDAKNGFIMLEDLGDVTLLRSLQNVSSPEVERKYFERAIDALVLMHTRSGPSHIQKNTTDEKINGFNLRFDTEKLMWEINFGIEHFYLKHLNRQIKPEDFQIIQDGFTKICKELDQEPTVFTHRDYHSRNLMVDGSRYVMIDFQDARMGPAQYDLASLLRDSYYQLEEKQIELLVSYYVNQMAIHGAPIKNRAHFDRIFDLMAVQRNFKAIGSFASFLNRRGNPGYLKFIGNTFENVRRNLLKYPEFSQLREVLFHYYYF